MSYASCNMPSKPLPSSVEFQPVMFWFYDATTDAGPQAQGIFCSPTLEAHDVVAVADLATGSLIAVESFANFSQDNNVTSNDGPLKGYVPNG